MEANVEQNNSPKEKVLVDFKYFIQSAIEKKIPWNVLTYFLTDLAPTLDKSKEVIEILVQELEKWVLKVENHGTPQIQPLSQNNAREFENEIQDRLMKISLKSLEKTYTTTFKMIHQFFDENDLEWQDLSEIKEIEKVVEEKVQQKENDRKM